MSYRYSSLDTLNFRCGTSMPYRWHSKDCLPMPSIWVVTKLEGENCNKAKSCILCDILLRNPVYKVFPSWDLSQVSGPLL